MAEPRGKVFRLVYPETGMPYVEHRSRDAHALFATEEWSWSRDLDESYVFTHYGPRVPADGNASATDHVAALCAAGEPHAHPSVFGSQAEESARLRGWQERRDRDLDHALEAHMKVDPQEVYERNERQGLA